MPLSTWNLISPRIPSSWLHKAFTASGIYAPSRSKAVSKGCRPPRALSASCAAYHSPVRRKPLLQPIPKVHGRTHAAKPSSSTEQSHRPTRSEIPPNFFRPEYLQIFIDAQNKDDGFEGLDAQSCAKTVADFASRLSEVGPKRSGLARACRDLDPFSLHFVSKCASLAHHKNLSALTQRVLVDLGYEPAVVTMYRAHIYVGSDVPRGSPDAVTLREQFSRIVAAGQYPDALVVQALERGMRGVEPETVLALLDHADELGKAAQADRESKYLYQLSHESMVARGKLLWTMRGGARREEAVSFLRPLALRDQLLGPMFWYAKALDDDDLDKEILLAKAALLGARAIHLENERLHMYKSANALEEDNFKVGEFHAKISRYYDKFSREGNDGPGARWLYTEAAKVWKVKDRSKTRSSELTEVSL